MALTTTPTNALNLAVIGNVALPNGAEISAFDPVSQTLYVTSEDGPASC